MVFLHKSGESFTAKFASNSPHGILIRVAHRQATQACGHYDCSFC